MKFLVSEMTALVKGGMQKVEHAAHDALSS